MYLPWLKARYGLRFFTQPEHLLVYIRKVVDEGRTRGAVKCTKTAFAFAEHVAGFCVGGGRVVAGSCGVVSSTGYYFGRGPRSALLFVPGVLCGHSHRCVLLDVPQCLCEHARSRSVSWLSCSLPSPLRCRSCCARSLGDSSRCTCISGFQQRRRLAPHPRARWEISVWDFPWLIISIAAELHGWAFEHPGDVTTDAQHPFSSPYTLSSSIQLVSGRHRGII